MTTGELQYVKQMESDLITESTIHSKLTSQKLAAKFGISDQNKVKELTELAIVNVTRKIAHDADLSQYERYLRIVRVYNIQANLSHRTSQSILLQQYSTPAPIAFVAGTFCGFHNKGSYFEPSAGNGLLTIVGDPQDFDVNEVDETRRENLQSQGFRRVFNQDASKDFRLGSTYFSTIQYDAIITNPPFGTLDKEISFDGTPIGTLDHLMVLNALDLLKPNGRAAAIIGGHTQWDEKGRVQAGKNRIFINHLYKHFNVADIINISGRHLYSRQGTAFNVRLILIDGKKETPEGVAPLFNASTDQTVMDFDTLYSRVSKYFTSTQSTDLNMKKLSLSEQEAEALALEMGMMESTDTADDDFSELGSPYIPAAKACVVLNTEVPDSLEYETQVALFKIQKEVGQLTDYVTQKLKYKSNAELCKALAAEQIDAVAMTIWNIEKKGQGMIIGDQTGIGKGRVAAALIRYGSKNGLQPIFMTEKPNLFSDIYRDLVAIGSGDLVPFIVNARDAKTDIKDEDGNVVHQALSKQQQESIFESQKVPSKYHFVCCTYSQFNSPDKKPTKPLFLQAISRNNVMVMDESHNASGESNTGQFLQDVVGSTKGVQFLSATFAKRPDNMPIYGMKTAISDANMTKDALVEAITRGGVALQEVLSSQLVKEGQMLRRERTYEGIEVNYITLDELESEHRQIADKITEIIRMIIGFQKDEIDPLIEELDSIMAAEQKEVTERQGTSEAGLTSQPYFSKVFNVINQMLFAIKAEAVADRAIMRLRQGLKPVIAFSSTMGSFLEDMSNTDGLPLQNGDKIKADFSEVLMRGLDGVMRYTEIDENGKPAHKKFDIAELPEGAQNRYLDIADKIKRISTGITISPIDLIVQKITKAGYKVAEVTGRKMEVQLNTKTMQGIVLSRKKVMVNDAFRQFNDNEVDCLLINQSGSTGASAHAIVTNKVPADKVKQRVMIVLQAELDINREVQKRGRINRTGQIMKPIYDYVSSAIPAEKRLSMMLQKKLKSLDANTTSNQKQSKKVLDVHDFLNKYGDKVVKEYLIENPTVNEMLNDPLRLKEASSDKSRNSPADVDAAHKVSGRVAVLSTEMQAEFYNDIFNRYNDYVTILMQRGEYDLEVEAMDLQAKTLDTMVIKSGKGGASSFGNDSILETVEVNVLRKPLTQKELLKELEDSTAGKTPREVQEEIISNFRSAAERKLLNELTDLQNKYKKLIENVPNERKISSIKDLTERNQAIADRIYQLEVVSGAAQDAAKKKYYNNVNYLTSIFEFFVPGRAIDYPVEDFDSGMHNVRGVFIGTKIDYKRPNPFAPSAIKLEIALSDSNRYLTIPASYTEEIHSIKGASVGIRSGEWNQTIENWDEITKQNTTNRKVRHIITGNILQAFSKYKGKLISYTTEDPDVIKKGILMPDNWEVPQDSISYVDVPIIKAEKLIMSLGVNQMVQVNNETCSIGKGTRETFYFYVPMGRNYKNIYTDADLMQLVVGNNFNLRSGLMLAEVEPSNMKTLIQTLQDKFSFNARVSRATFDMISQNEPKRAIEPDEPEDFILPKKITEIEQDDFSIRLKEAEAEALLLELEMLEM